MSARPRNRWQRWYRFFWSTHKWTGIIAALFLVNIAATGFLLLVKKEFPALQPPTQKGVEGEVADFITSERLFEIVLAQGHPDFRSIEDIDRVDFRPSKRVHKVRSKHNYAEMQVDAVSGAVLGVDWRMSDWIESLHDGSWFGEPVHGWLFPIVAFALFFLVLSGLYLWLAPIWKRVRSRTRRS